MPTTTVSIPGMHCEGCAKLIEDVTADYPMVTNVNVDLNAKTVAIEHNPDFDLEKWSEELESLDAKYRIHRSVP
jgi:copper chaperone